MRVTIGAILAGLAFAASSVSAQARQVPAAGSEPAPGYGSVEHGIGGAPGAPEAPLAGTRQLSAMQSTCQPRPVFVRWTYRNRFQVTLFRYTEQVYFCFTGTEVTYFYRDRWPELPSLLPGAGFNPWSFDGNTASNCEGEHCFIRDYRASSRTAWTQGQFSACVSNAICITQLVALKITVYGDGTYNVESHGS